MSNIRAMLHLSVAIICFITLASFVSAQDQNTVLTPGVYQAEDHGVKLPDDAKVVDVEGAEFGKAVETISANFSAYGTNIGVRIKGPVNAIFDGRDTLFIADAQLYKDYIQQCTGSLTDCPLRENSIYLGNDWNEVAFEKTVLPETRHIAIMVFLPGTTQIDSITVTDRTFENIFPYAAGVAIAVGMIVFVVVSAVRERRGY